MKNHNKDGKFVFPNPVDHYCQFINESVHLILKILENNPDNISAFHNAERSIDSCMEKAERLSSYLSMMRDIIESNEPLPF